MKVGETSIKISNKVKYCQTEMIQLIVTDQMKVCQPKQNQVKA